MQPLTAPPRDHLTADQVRHLLTCDSLTIDGGLDLLDANGMFIEDISRDLEAGSITRDNRAAVHASFRLSLQRRLDWGAARVKPYVVLSDDPISPSVTARFNLGVFILTRPDEERGELVEVNDDAATPPELRTSYSVTGFDVLSLLQNGPADTWVAVANGTNTYYDAITAAMTAADVGIPLLLPGDLADLVIPATRVWAVTSPIPSWLRIITDLLFEAGYAAPWADENGAITTRAFQDPAARAVEWTIDTRETATSIIDETRTLSQETGDIANWWRFVRSNNPSTPVEGNGIYTVENLTDGPASQARLDRTVRKWVQLEAANHVALVAQGDKIVAGDMAAVRTVTLQVDPLPVMGHDDVFWYVDGTGVDLASEKLTAASWTLNLDGSRGQLQLGGVPRGPLPVIEARAQATVTDDSPLRVVVDGATVDSFANALNATAYDVGDRVSVTIRNPLPPLIQGIES